MKELRRQYPGANLAPIDYDPGVSAVNQLNRIRLMMTTAKKRMNKVSDSVEKSETESKLETAQAY